MVKDLYSSYKDLPLSIYQIQTKYRDEARPRAGILRGREFVMKDSYSFDVDDAGLQASYDGHRAAYLKTFDRLGPRLRRSSRRCPARWAAARARSSSPRRETGEDTYVRCTNGDYAANVEAVDDAARRPRCPYDDVPAAHVEDTPDTPTIDTLVDRVQRARRPAPRRPRLDRRRHAEERRRAPDAPRRHAASCSPSACPATARST